MSDSVVQWLRETDAPKETWVANGVGHLFPKQEETAVRPGVRAIRVDEFDELLRRERAARSAPTAETLGEIVRVAAEKRGLVVAAEYRFAPPRRFRADFALFRNQVEAKPVLMLEFDGGTWLQTSNGRSAGHAHPKRFASDCEKLNIAAMMGIPVLRYTPKMVKDGDAQRDIEAFLSEL